MWPFSDKNPVSVDKLGPDKPRVTIQFHVQRVVLGGAAPKGTATVVLHNGSLKEELFMLVPTDAAIKRFPSDSWVTFVLEDQP